MQIKLIVDPILSWYRREKRILPFRLTSNPYKIWLSEVMLQQTRVNTVIPYYNSWIESYPSVASVAKAKISSLLKIWEGLGYYSRCKNFHKACKIVVNDFQGIVPSKLATKVPAEYPVPLVLTVEVGASSKSLNIFHFPESVASLKIPPYKSLEPLSS